MKRGPKAKTRNRYDDLYYRDLASCRPMSVDEERVAGRELAELRRQRDALDPETDPASRLAVDEALGALHRRFVRCNLRLVVKLAAQYHDGQSPLSDLIQEGNIGLLMAIERFDPSREVRFCTYAAWWVRHRIGRALHNTGRAVAVPTHLAQTASKLRRAARSLRIELGRSPNEDELAERVGVSTRKVRTALATTASGLSLDKPLGDDDGRSMKDLLVDDDVAIDASLEEQQLREAVAAAIAALAPLEADIVRHRFSFGGEEPVTLRELGEKHALSRERIRQLQMRALDKLRRHLEPHRPEAA